MHSGKEEVSSKKTSGKLSFREYNNNNEIITSDNVSGKKESKEESTLGSLRTKPVNGSAKQELKHGVTKPKPLFDSVKIETKPGSPKTQDSVRRIVKKDPTGFVESKDGSKSSDSRKPPSSGIKNTNKKIITKAGGGTTVTVPPTTENLKSAATSRELEGKDLSVQKNVDLKISTDACQSAKPAVERRVSSGAQIMSRFAPRPYRSVSVDTKAVRTRSQSVEVQPLASRSISSEYPNSQPLQPTKCSLDDNKLREMLHINSTASGIVFNETLKSNLTVISTTLQQQSAPLSSSFTMKSVSSSHAGAAPLTSQSKVSVAPGIGGPTVSEVRRSVPVTITKSATDYALGNVRETFSYTKPITTYVSSLDNTKTAFMQSSGCVSSRASIEAVKPTNMQDVKCPTYDATVTTTDDDLKQNKTSPIAEGINKSVKQVPSFSSSAGVKHRAIIRSCPESLLFTSTPLLSSTVQRFPDDKATVLRDERTDIGTSKPSEIKLNPCPTLKTSVALESSSSSSSSSSSDGLKRPFEGSAFLFPSPISGAIPSNQTNSSIFSSPARINVVNGTLNSGSSIGNAIQHSKTSLESSTISPRDSSLKVDSPSVMLSSSDLLYNDNTSDKIDTSHDSVSSALSVLMKRQSASGTMVPASPKCSYRYGSRGAISSIYQNKLGSAASSQYNKNMDEIYGNFFQNLKGGHPVAKGVNNAPASSTSSTPLHSLTTVEHQSSKMPDFGVKRQEESNFPADDQSKLSLYLSTNENRTRCNAPPPIRRVLSCDSTTRSKTNSPILSSESRRLFFEGHLESTKGDQRPSVIVSSASVNGPYDPPLNGEPSFIDDLQADLSPSEVVCVSDSSCLRQGQRKSKCKRNVSFEPMSLLLNAALEGELDLVKLTIPKVSEAVISNECRVTALHNAVYSGHYDVCRFLIEYGCKVNATDADGWTPLHCAASCNNVDMAKVLVQNGACFFSTTFVDREIPIQKCRKDLPGYDSCYKYLSEQGQAIGNVNNGIVYATSDYSGSGSDELSFHEADQLKVIRKGDEAETEWWWAEASSFGSKQGYIPRNYMALYPSRQKRY